MQAASQGPLYLIDRILSSTPQEDPRFALLHALRNKIMEEELTLQQVQSEIKKLNQVVEKVTSPANRIGTLLGLPTPEMAHIVVGGSDYYANVDPRLKPEELKPGRRILVNEAFVVIGLIEDDPGGSVVKVIDCLPDGRLRVGQEPGQQTIILTRSYRLLETKLQAGDEIRTDSNHRVAVEKVDQPRRRAYFLEEVPRVEWEEIGGQQEAIEAVRNTIEHPLLYPDLFVKYDYAQPKGFLLYGPPGCGKTMIGKATANMLVRKLRAKGQEHVTEFFLHVKGPEILNMWLGESERMIRELFTRAREKRGAGFLPFIFIDEAESILGMRRSNRSHNILNTLVPMFCAELDGVESLKELVIILASNRPDLIDPAVLRPGRIDRKIKILRPDRNGSEEILKIYLPDRLPIAASFLEHHGNNSEKARQTLLHTVLQAVFTKGPEQRILELYLRNGRREILYRSDLVSGALLMSIVQRAKEHAIKRAVKGQEDGIGPEDLLLAVDQEYAEGEMLPPSDNLEEWLKLIDMDPENVVGLSLFGKQPKPPIEKKVI